MGFESLSSTYADGTHQKTIAFRVVSQSRQGFSAVVCGLCAAYDKTAEGRTSCGWMKCEICGDRLGRPDAHNAALIIQKELVA
jgi:hypothetical protein